MLITDNAIHVSQEPYKLALLQVVLLKALYK